MSDSDKLADVQAGIRRKIELLTDFKHNIALWFNGEVSADLRTRINEAIPTVRATLRETGCLKLVTMGPPPAIGGMMVRDADPFQWIFGHYFGMSLVPTICDMIDEAVGVLKSPEYLEQSIQSLSAPTQNDRIAVEGLRRVIHLCRRFPHVVRQLQQRHDNRRTLVVEDEYDAQDLFRALLRLDFQDVRPEEWTPSYAGRSARVDFLLKQEQIVIELKKTRVGLGTKEVGDQLLVDIGRYGAHPSCTALVCLVYDPEFRIGNPASLESDLTRKHDRIDVYVIVTPGDEQKKS